MGMVIRLSGIITTNSFNVFIKEGDTAYPLESGYTQYNGTFTPDIHQIDISLSSFKFNTQYWVKIVDVITGRYIIENIYLNDDIAYINCDETCEFYGIAEYVPPVTPTPTPTPSPSRPPDVTPIDCGVPVPYSGEQGDFVYEIKFPENTFGEIILTYDAIHVPDRFRVIYDDVEVINTGFVSEYFGSTNSYERFLLDGWDRDLVDLGYPVTQGTNGSKTFTKSTSTTSAFVHVDAPLSGIAWNFTLSCGNIAPTPTPTPSSNFVYSFTIKYGDTPIEACTGTITTIFAKTNNPGIGDIICKDPNCTQPWDITNYIIFTNPSLYNYEVVNVSIVADIYNAGEIISLTGEHCNAPTPTPTPTPTPSRQVQTGVGTLFIHIPNLNYT